MNLDKKTTKSNYFSAQGFCNESKDCKVEYSIKIKCKDEDESKGFVTLDVVRNQHEHSHSDKKTQIRGKLIFRYYSYSLFTYYSILGDERDELAKACLVEANGSPFNFVNNRIAEVIKDADGNEGLALLPGQLGKFRRIVGTCVREFLHKEMVILKFQF